MSASQTIPFTIAFHGHEADAEVFIAGSFSDPAWELHEMERNTLDGTDAYFTKTVHTEQGKDYLYRFRLGRSGPWTVDETKPISTFLQALSPTPAANHSELIAKDEHGNRVNIFYGVPGESFTTLKSNGTESLTSPLGNEQDNASKAPLFSHECLGAYEITVEDIDVDPLDSSVPRKSEPMVPSADSIDINDPTLEVFPSDHDAIMSTLRKIQSSRSEDAVTLDDGRRSSTDSANGSAGSPPGSGSGHVSPASRRRGASGSERLAPLGAISEEPLR